VTVTASIQQVAPGKLPGNVRALLFVRDQGLLVLWLAIVVVFAFWGAPHFFTLSTGISVLNSAAIAAIYAAGVGVGVMTGVLDLSVPATAAFSGVVTAQLLKAGAHVSVAILVGLVAGVAIGVINGLIVIRGFNGLIVTIAMLTSLSGVSLLLANDTNISQLTQLRFLGTQTYLGIPAPVYVALGLYVALTVFLRSTRNGMRLLAVGGNAEAARRVGIAVDRYRVAGFAISGFCAAVGGIVTAAYIATAVPGPSIGIVFSAMTAVALAGIPFTGGRGSLPRVALGAVVIATISAGLLLSGVSSNWSAIITGALLIGGLGLNMWTTTMTSKLLLAGQHVPRKSRKL
jgi:ribose transport system permease protein